MQKFKAFPPKKLQYKMNRLQDAMRVAHKNIWPLVRGQFGGCLESHLAAGNDGTERPMATPAKVLYILSLVTGVLGVNCMSFFCFFSTHLYISLSV